jgi:hypothetical protein
MSRQRSFFNRGVPVAALLLIVAAAASGPGAVKGVGLGIGIGACAGVVAHEISTERIVHVTEVVERPPGEGTWRSS